MRRLHRGAHVDVWPAFTDFLTSVSFLLVALLLATPWFFSVEALMPRGDQEDPLKDIKRAQEQIRTVLIRDLRLKPHQIDPGLTDQRIIFSEDQGALFATNSAVPTAGFRGLVDRLSATLRPHLALLERIEVEGHTDSDPFPAGARTNWELSAERAAAVAKLLADGGIPPYKLSAKGYSKYHPADTEVSDRRTAGGEFAYIAQANQGERAKRRNRRIEILLVYAAPGPARR